MSPTPSHHRPAPDRASAARTPAVLFAAALFAAGVLLEAQFSFAAAPGACPAPVAGSGTPACKR